MSIKGNNALEAPSQAIADDANPIFCFECHEHDGERSFSASYRTEYNEPLCDKCGKRLSDESDEHGSNLYSGIYEF